MSQADLSSFWKRTIEELAHSGPNPEMEEAPEQSARDYRTRRLVLDSFQGKRLRGWYTTPTDPPPAGKSPAFWRFQATAAPRSFPPIWR